MTAVFRKLKSRAAASMVIALSFLLICAVVGSMVLAVASASAGRMAREQLAGRRRLAVTSAARLIAQDLKEAEYHGAYCHVETTATTVTTTMNGSGEEVSSTSVSRNEHVEKAEEKCGFSETSSLLTDSSLPDMTQFFYSKLTADGMGELTTAPPLDPVACRLSFGAEEEMGIPAVSGLLTVGSNYEITITLWDEENGSRVTMFFPASASLPTPTETVTELSEEENTASKTVSTYYTTTVTWDEPVITGGGEL